MTEKPERMVCWENSSLAVTEAAIDVSILNLRVSRPLDREHHCVLVDQVVLGQTRLVEEPLLTVVNPLPILREGSQNPTGRCPFDQRDICRVPANL